MTLPTEFKERMRALLGSDAEFEKFLLAFEKEQVRGLRINILKIDAEKFSDFSPYGSLTPIPFCKDSFYFKLDGIGNTPFHHAGAIYIQEPGAMMPVACCNIKEGMKILDVCAAPGGKTLQAAAKLSGKGVIVSNEIIPSRVQILMQNIERLGVRNSIVTNTDSATLAKTFTNFFDLVIVDAPCSGEGMMRKNPLAVSEWSVENVKMCAERQSEILENSAKTVKPGGTLLYSTCTFSIEENEEQIDKFLSSHPDFSLAPVPGDVIASSAPGISVGGRDMSDCRRFYPHISEGEGQFMAILVRSKSSKANESECALPSLQSPKKDKRKKSHLETITNNKNSDKINDAEREIVLSFLRNTLREGYAQELLSLENDEGYILTSKTDGFYLTPPIPLPEKELFSPGVKIGTVQKGRIIPHHQFFMAFGKDFRRKADFEPSAPDVTKYIHGDTFDTSLPDGYAVITVCGCTLGGIKVSGGTAKNLYPKGLRRA